MQPHSRGRNGAVRSVAAAARLGLAAIAGSLLSFVAPGGTAVAVPIDYGTHVGDQVNYVDVREDSGALPLFGTPHVTGDSLDFNPLGFDASSANGGSEMIYHYDTQGPRTGITGLLTDLSRAGIRFKDLDTSQSSLEDIFVDLVRGDR